MYKDIIEYNVEAEQENHNMFSSIQYLEQNFLKQLKDTKLMSSLKYKHSMLKVVDPHIIHSMIYNQQQFKNKIYKNIRILRPIYTVSLKECQQQYINNHDDIQLNQNMNIIHDHNPYIIYNTKMSIIREICKHTLNNYIRSNHNKMMQSFIEKEENNNSIAINKYSSNIHVQQSNYKVVNTDICPFNMIYLNNETDVNNLNTILEYANCIGNNSLMQAIYKTKIIFSPSESTDDYDVIKNFIINNDIKNEKIKYFYINDHNSQYKINNVNIFKIKSTISEIHKSINSEIIKANQELILLIDSINKKLDISTIKNWEDITLKTKKYEHTICSFNSDINNNITIINRLMNTSEFDSAINTHINESIKSSERNQSMYNLCIKQIIHNTIECNVNKIVIFTNNINNTLNSIKKLNKGILREKKYFKNSKPTSSINEYNYVLIDSFCSTNNSNQNIEILVVNSQQINKKTTSEFQKHLNEYKKEYILNITNTIRMYKSFILLQSFANAHLISKGKNILDIHEYIKDSCETILDYNLIHKIVKSSNSENSIYKIMENHFEINMKEIQNS